MQLQIFGDSVNERLRYWRKEVARISQAELAGNVNALLEESDQVAVTTVSNYERSTEPRASFLAALKRSFPDLNLDWLITGKGNPEAWESRVAEVLSRVDVEEGLGGFSELMKQPGLQRFKVLPQGAQHVVYAFLEEVRLSSSDYESGNSRAWRDFVQRFSQIFFEPFQAPRHFVAQDDLAAHEFTTYALQVVAGLRPLVLSITGRQSRLAPRLTPAGGGGTNVREDEHRTGRGIPR